MFFTRVCLTVVVLLLLTLAPAFADSYLRVNQRSVICYYFNNRHTAEPYSTQAKQPAEPTPVLQKVVPSKGPSPRLYLPLASIIVPSRFDAESPTGQTGQLMPEATEPAADADSLDCREKVETAPNRLIKFLTRLNFFTSSDSFPGG